MVERSEVRGHYAVAYSELGAIPALICSLSYCKEPDYGITRLKIMV